MSMRVSLSLAPLYWFRPIVKLRLCNGCFLSFPAVFQTILLVFFFSFFEFSCVVHCYYVNIFLLDCSAPVICVWQSLYFDSGCDCESKLWNNKCEICLMYWVAKQMLRSLHGWFWGWNTSNILYVTLPPKMSRMDTFLRFCSIVHSIDVSLKWCKKYLNRSTGFEIMTM